MNSDPPATVIRVELDPRSGGWQVRLPGEPAICCQTRAQAEQAARQGAEHDQRQAELPVLDAYARVIEHRQLTPATNATSATECRQPHARPRAPSDAAARTPLRTASASPTSRTAVRATDTESPCP